MPRIDPSYGPAGRYTYETAQEARAVADQMGLSGVHKHRQGGRLVFMPGESHAELERALETRGLPSPNRKMQLNSDDSGADPEPRKTTMRLFDDKNDRMGMMDDSDMDNGGMPALGMGMGAMQEPMQGRDTDDAEEALGVDERPPPNEGLEFDEMGGMNEGDTAFGAAFTGNFGNDVNDGDEEGFY
jgi:Protein of unknown function.